MLNSVAADDEGTRRIIPELTPACLAPQAMINRTTVAALG